MMITFFRTANLPYIGTNPKIQPPHNIHRPNVHTSARTFAQPQLTSPVTPSRNQTTNNRLFDFTRKPLKRVWSEHDSSILEFGMQMFADHPNKWKMILNTFKNHSDPKLRFQESWSNVNLKDRWRNMNKN